MALKTTSYPDPAVTSLGMGPIAGGMTLDDYRLLSVGSQVRCLLATNVNVKQGGVYEIVEFRSQEDTPGRLGYFLVNNESGQNWCTYAGNFAVVPMETPVGSLASDLLTLFQTDP